MLCHIFVLVFQTIIMLYFSSVAALLDVNTVAAEVHNKAVCINAIFTLQV